MASRQPRSRQAARGRSGQCTQQLRYWKKSKKRETEHRSCPAHFDRVNRNTPNSHGSVIPVRWRAGTSPYRTRGGGETAEMRNNRTIRSRVLKTVSDTGIIPRLSFGCKGTSSATARSVRRAVLPRTVAPDDADSEAEPRSKSSDARVVSFAAHPHVCHAATSG